MSKDKEKLKHDLKHAPIVERKKLSDCADLKGGRKAINIDEREENRNWLKKGDK